VADIIGHGGRDAGKERLEMEDWKGFRKVFGGRSGGTVNLLIK